MTIKSETALLPPPCEELPINGRPLMLGRGNQLTARGRVGSSGISNESITLGHMIGGLRDIIFGAGYDGEADFNGTATVLGIVPSGGEYGLTRDIICTRLHVRAGATIKTSGYGIKCRELVLYGSAIIHRDGNNGIDATSRIGAVKPGAPSNAIVGGGGDGGDGGNGGDTPSQGGFNGTAGSAATGVSYGGAGGTGADGDSIGGGGGGGSGASGGSVSASITASTTNLSNLDRLHAGLSFICGGAGGGGGGGGGASGAGDDGGGGGSGGSGGGVLLIVAERITLVSWTGRISSNGGTGGAGFNSALGGDAGCGGGGGGGFVQVVYHSVSGGSLVASPAIRNGAAVSGGNVKAEAGAGGTGTGGVNPGANGTSGYVVLLDLGVPFIPAAEYPAFTSAPPRPAARRLSASHIQAMRTRSPKE